MPLAIITDSTCDLRPDELERLDARRVPLYVSFRGETHRDWLDITPREIVEGVAAGAALPTTSQPSPQDFEAAYREAVEAGADRILCLTLSSELSGTYQSATLASESVAVPVTVFDSRAASLGLGDMVKAAAELRDAGAPFERIVAAVEHIRDTNFLLFTPASLEFLQKGGRIGRAGALLGSLLNIQPILTLEHGAIAPVARARGAKKAQREIVSRLQAYRQGHPGAAMVVSFIHIQDEGVAADLRAAVDAAGIEYRDGGTYEIGAVLASHVGPGTVGLYAHTEYAHPEPEA